METTWISVFTSRPLQASVRRSKLIALMVARALRPRAVFLAEDILRVVTVTVEANHTV